MTPCSRHRYDERNICRRCGAHDWRVAIAHLAAALNTISHVAYAGWPDHEETVSGRTNEPWRWHRVEAGCQTWLRRAAVELHSLAHPLEQPDWVAELRRLASLCQDPGADPETVERIAKKLDDMGVRALRFLDRREDDHAQPPDLDETWSREVVTTGRDGVTTLPIPGVADPCLNRA